jgi:SAM-dependent methyltransferase
MRKSPINRQVRRMRQAWDQRAQENARYYVATGRKDWSDEAFFEDGESELRDHVYNDLGNICQGKNPKDMKVLEIGCGAGRLTVPLARFFGEVYAVDISREMVRHARRATMPYPNAHVFQNNGKDLSVLRPRWWHFGKREKPQFDFAFSCLVFQHIPSRDVIESYVRDTNRLLRPGGLFKFQVQGHPDTMPEAEDTWIGAPFDEKTVRKIALRCGFELRYQYGAGSQYYWLWFFKTKEVR